MAVKGQFAGLTNVSGAVVAADEVVINDVSVGHADKVSAAHLSSLRTVTALPQATSTTLTRAQAGLVVVSNTSAMALVLPAAATSVGIEYVIVKATTDAAAITIDGNSSETINGATTLATVDAQYDTATIICNGTLWYVVSKLLA